MDRNTQVVVNAKRRVTEREIAVAKVKLMGLMVLCAVDVLVIACTKLVP
jgi:hypothetical protein